MNFASEFYKLIKGNNKNANANIKVGELASMLMKLAIPTYANFTIMSRWLAEYKQPASFMYVSIDWLIYHIKCTFSLIC